MTAGEIAPAVRSRARLHPGRSEKSPQPLDARSSSRARGWSISNGREHAMRIGFPGTGTAGRRLRPEVAGPEHEVPPEPDTMEKDTAELAYRRGAGIEVTLLWHRTSGEL